MSSDLVIGTLLSIPIGIGTGIAVDPVKRWWQRRNESNHAKRLDQIKDEYMDVLYCAIHSDLMLATFVLKGTFVTLFVLYLVMLKTLEPYEDVLTEFLVRRLPVVSHATVVLLAGTEWLLFVGMAVYIGVFTFRGYRLYTRVRFFKTYVKTIPDSIRDPELEDMVSAGRWNRGLSIVTGFAKNVTIATQNTHADAPAIPSEPPPLEAQARQ